MTSTAASGMPTKTSNVSVTDNPNAPRRKKRFSAGGSGGRSSLRPPDTAAIHVSGADGPPDCGVAIPSATKVLQLRSRRDQPRIVAVPTGEQHAHGQTLGGDADREGNRRIAGDVEDRAVRREPPLPVEIHRRGSAGGDHPPVPAGHQGGRAAGLVGRRGGRRGVPAPGARRAWRGGGGRRSARTRARRCRVNGSNRASRSGGTGASANTYQTISNSGQDAGPRARPTSTTRGRRRVSDSVARSTAATQSGCTVQSRASAW